MMTEGGSCDVVCDLCEDEQAVSFCDECHSKVCTLCQDLHVRQKQTKIHNLTTIEKVKLLVLNVKCSFCDGKAETFCSECNVRLCTKCVMSHHKLCNIAKQASGDQASDGQEITGTHNVSDQTTNVKENSNEGLSHDSSKLMIKDSVPQRSTVIINDLHVQSGILCDLCEEEIAACFCEDCQKQMCAFCQQGHIKQKITKYHKLSAIENTTRSILHTICSSCNQHAEKVCNQCEVRFCTKCSDAHHYLSDTLVLRKEISNTEHECEDQVSGRHFTPGSFVYKLDTLNATLQPPENGINQSQFYQVGGQECDGEVSGKVNKSKGLSAEGGTGKCVNDKRGQAIKRDDTINDEESNGGVSKKDTNIKGNENWSKHRDNIEDISKENQELKEDRPGKPFVEEIFTDSVEIAWKGLETFRTGDGYQVYIRNAHTGMSGMNLFETNCGKIGGLQPGSEYVFKVRLVKSEGEVTKYSENSEVVRTKEKTKVDSPGQPRVGNIKTDSVDIYWDDMLNFRVDDVYQVHIRNVQRGDERTEKFQTNGGRITGLQPGTQFVFKVRLVLADAEESEYSDEVMAHTKDSYALMLLHESKLVKTYTNGLRVYQLPMMELQEARNKYAMTNKFHLGPREQNDRRQKTIMLVGATGTGKSTFVDCLANYILGVRQEDTFRFTVTRDEDRVRQHNQAESQTDWISCYSFNPQPGNRLNYRINIIDTPGFGDVRGLLRDNETVDHIRQLFEETGQKGVQNLDAVCFLVKAPDSRLTEVLTYIFQAIMSLFGSNMKDNICTIMTFVDGSGPPPALSALEASKLPFGQSFSFNNSALISDPNADLSSLFWKMNLHSYEKMFSHFETLETKSIHLTKEVLQKKRRLDITCQNLQIKLDAGLLAVDSLSKEIKIYQDNEEKIKNNENFTYVVTEKKEVKVPVPDGLSNTYCLKCNETCHRSCWITYESLTGWCWAMNWLTGNCGECSGKCHWRYHINRSYRTEISYGEVTKTYEEMQKKFQNASGCRLTLEQILKIMDAKLDEKANLIDKMLTEMWECKNRLADIALRSSPYEMTDLIGLLISTEMYERGQGYIHRIEVLNKILKQTEINERLDDFQNGRWCVKQALRATLDKSSST